MLVVPIPFPCYIQYSFPHVDMSVPLSIGVSSIRPPSLNSNFQLAMLLAKPRLSCSKVEVECVHRYEYDEYATLCWPYHV